MIKIKRKRVGESDKYDSGSKPFSVHFSDGTIMSLVEEKDLASFTKEQESKGCTVINLFDLVNKQRWH